MFVHTYCMYIYVHDQCHCVYVATGLCGIPIGAIMYLDCICSKESTMHGDLPKATFKTVHLFCTPLQLNKTLLGLSILLIEAICHVSFAQEATICLQCMLVLTTMREWPAPHTNCIEYTYIHTWRERGREYVL